MRKNIKILFFLFLPLHSWIAAEICALIIKECESRGLLCILEEQKPKAAAATFPSTTGTSPFETVASREDLRKKRQRKRKLCKRNSTANLSREEAAYNADRFPSRGRLRIYFCQKASSLTVWLHFAT